MATYTMFRGDTFVFADQILTPTSSTVVGQVIQYISRGKANELGIQGIPINITGFRIWFTMKKQVEDADPGVTQLDNLALGGVLITTPINGQYQVTIPTLATRGMQDGQWSLLYDVQVKDAGGAIVTVDFGAMIVNPDITLAIQ